MTSVKTAEQLGWTNWSSIWPAFSLVKRPLYKVQIICFKQEVGFHFQF